MEDMIVCPYCGFYNCESFYTGHDCPKMEEITSQTEYPGTPLPCCRPGIDDLDDGKSIFTPELCREAIRRALPSDIANNYISEVECEKGEEYWQQFDSPEMAVHDARIYWDALTEPEVIQQVYRCQGWNL